MNTPFEAVQDFLIQQSSGSILHSHFKSSSEFSNLLEPLLVALKWTGTQRQIIEALPAESDRLDVDELQNILARLQYKCTWIRQPLQNISAHSMPVLFVPEGDSALLLLKKEGEECAVFNSVTQSIEILNKPKLKGTAYLFTAHHLDEPEPSHWIQHTFNRFKKALPHIAFMSLGINLLLLTLPLFALLLCNQAIGNASESWLCNLTLVAFFLTACCYILQAHRSQILSFLGARLDQILSEDILKKLLLMPPQTLENSTESEHIAKIKQFDEHRELITHAFFNTVLEIPFIALSLIGIALLGGTLVCVPLAAVLLSLVFYAVIRKRNETLLSNVSIHRQILLSESLAHLETIKACHAESTWMNRFKDLQGQVSHSMFRSAYFRQRITLIAESILALAGITLLMVGAFQVMSDQLTWGALLAILMLSSRALIPLKTFLSLVPRFNHLQSKMTELDQWMSLPSEHRYSDTIPILTTHKEGLEFSRVSFRYRPNAAPALLNISLKIPPQGLICLTGKNGSGKSTLLKLIPRFYPLQTGQIYFKGINLQQIPVIQLRQTIAYLPQTPHIFSGTIEENLRYADPLATQQQLEQATQLADVYSDILQLPLQFQTQLNPNYSHDLSKSFLQRLALARTYLKKSSLYLFDEPTTSLDEKSEKALLSVFSQLKQHATVIVATHRTEHMEMADRIIHLDHGQIVFNGPVNEFSKPSTLEVL